MEESKPKVWTPAPVSKIVHDTQTDVVRPVPIPEALTEAEAEKPQQLPYLTGKWVRLNADGRVVKIIGFGSPPPFDYAGMVATPSNVTRDAAGVVSFIPQSLPVAPLVNGTFVVLPDDADLIALVAEAQAIADAEARRRAEAASY